MFTVGETVKLGTGPENFWFQNQNSLWCIPVSPRDEELLYPHLCWSMAGLHRAKLCFVLFDLTRQLAFPPAALTMLHLHIYIWPFILKLCLLSLTNSFCIKNMFSWSAQCNIVRPSLKNLFFMFDKI